MHVKALLWRCLTADESKEEKLERFEMPQLPSILHPSFNHGCQSLYSRPPIPQPTPQLEHGFPRWRRRQSCQVRSSASSPIFVHLLITPSQLRSDNTLVTIHTNGPDVELYPVEKTVLAIRADKLADHCFQRHIHLDVSAAAFRIFHSWLLYGDISKVENRQVSLAQA